MIKLDRNGNPNYVITSINRNNSKNIDIISSDVVYFNPQDLYFEITKKSK